MIKALTNGSRLVAVSLVAIAVAGFAALVAFSRRSNGSKLLVAPIVFIVGVAVIVLGVMVRNARRMR